MSDFVKGDTQTDEERQKKTAVAVDAGLQPSALVREKDFFFCDTMIVKLV